jgi:uncharacterized protein (DUF305 family)
VPTKSGTFRSISRAVITILTRLAVAAALAVGLGACGGGAAAEEPIDENVDGAFIAHMVHHHEEAIEMAELASEHGEHAELKELAHEMVESQEKEIEQLEKAYKGLFDVELPAHAQHGDLGLSDEERVSHMEIWMLEDPDEFDREFLDMLIHHHQGAVRMSRVMEEDGSDEDLKEIAEHISSAQSSELKQMKEWRKEWFGNAPLSDGVPQEHESVSGEETHESPEKPEDSGGH